MAIRREGPLENDGEYGDTSGLDCSLLLPTASAKPLSDCGFYRSGA